MLAENDHDDSVRRAKGAGDLLTIGFGTTVGMWAAGYVLHSPAIAAPGPLTAAAMAMCLIVGGFLCGKTTGRGWLGGAVAGLITAALNLLIVGAILHDDVASASPTALGWVPGTLAATALVMGICAAIGARGGGGAYRAANWSGRFATVAVAATTLLIAAGGLVTGREAGLAVPDWPRSYGYNMFFYPLARMTGNIYYEHTHRLVGSLVGLTTIVLAIHLWRAERRRWVCWFATVAIVAVIAQGVMGGLRVTSAINPSGAEVAQAEHETTASTALRVAHGVSGQLFFAMMVALAAFCSTTWRSDRDPTAHASTKLDQRLTIALWCVVIYQLLVGAALRHVGHGLMQHIAIAVIVLFGVMIIAMRIWGLYGNDQPLLKRLAVILLFIVTVQVMLGFAALIVTRLAEKTDTPSDADVLITTLHQFNGAALLAVVTLLMLFMRRLTQPAAT